MPIFGVGLLLGAACVSMGSSGSGPSSTAETTTSALAAPGSPAALRADQPAVWRSDPESWSVVLTWLPPSGVQPGSYEVTRDGLVLEEALAGTRLVDQDVLPRTTYRYGVTAVDVVGARGETASVKVVTDAPAVGGARLQGRFRMRMHVLGQRGLRDYVGGGTMLFGFDPGCADGPCDVRWRRQGRSGSGRLVRRAASYHGEVRASFQIRSCDGRRRKERLSFHLRVAAAAVIRGRWRATRIRGRLRESAPAPGCVTARIQWTFAGSLQA